MRPTTSPISDYENYYNYVQYCNYVNHNNYTNYYNYINYLNSFYQSPNFLSNNANARPQETTTNSPSGLFSIVPTTNSNSHSPYLNVASTDNLPGVFLGSPALRAKPTETLGNNVGVNQPTGIVDDPYVAARNSNLPPVNSVPDGNSSQSPNFPFYNSHQYDMNQNSQQNGMTEMRMAEQDNIQARVEITDKAINHVHVNKSKEKCSTETPMRKVQHSSTPYERHTPKKATNHSMTTPKKQSVEIIIPSNITVGEATEMLDVLIFNNDVDTNNTADEIEERLKSVELVKVDQTIFSNTKRSISTPKKQFTDSIIISKFTVEEANAMLDAKIDNNVVNTEQIADGIKKWLKSDVQKKVNQTMFANNVLGRCQTTLYSLLKNPKPWEQLTNCRLIYVRMYNWLLLTEEQKNAFMKLELQGDKYKKTENKKNQEAKRLHFKFNNNQKSFLMNAFAQTPYPDRSQMEYFAQYLKVEYSRINNFFTKARYRSKHII